MKETHILRGGGGQPLANGKKFLSNLGGWSFFHHFYALLVALFSLQNTIKDTQWVW